MTDKQLEHRQEVKAAIQRAMAAGVSTFDEIIASIGAPDPRLVLELIQEVMKEPAGSKPTRNVLDASQTRARRLSAEVPLLLPAPDPIRSQWWFTLDSVVQLATKVLEYGAAGSAVFLGAPTVGFYYSHWLQSPATILDTDLQVLNALEVPAGTTKAKYDVADPIGLDLKESYTVALVDPPWYPSLTELFISRAREMLVKNAFILCILPSRLTRPGIVEERAHLLNRLLEANFEIVALESGYVSYRVPEFELRAYRDIDDFSGRQWRKGDLLVLRVSPSASLIIPSTVVPFDPLVFSRNPRLMRFFLDVNRITSDQPEWFKPIPEFETSVSARESNVDIISVWGTNKKGGVLRDLNLAKQILELWADDKSQSEVTSALTTKGVKDAAHRVAELQAGLELWTDEPKPKRRRTPVQLLKFRGDVLSDLASQPSDRAYPHKTDDFRLPFQRDRDRVLWSNALRRLANKTQLFPVTSDDHLQRRLTHTIEVMQLSSTIASSFGLDKDLTEAGALAHDVGHTPFGHAGEHALNHVLTEIDPRLGGFNHYEHGVDVVRWLEDAYRSPGAGAFPGLNLTQETVECILKHTFHRNSERLGQSSLIAATKHTDIQDDSCHLEGQAVRIADKISYLISDLGDGIRIGAFTYKDLMACRLFERPPIDMSPGPGESLHARFISQRRAILKVLMEDILTSSDRRLARLSTLAKVRSERDYTIDFSIAVKADIAEIWKLLQAGKLHKQTAVIAENMRAARIVRDLCLIYAATPDLVEAAYRSAHYGLADTKYIRWYENKVGATVGLPKRLLSLYSYEHMLTAKLQTQGDNWLVPITDLILAKDYVAGLTDNAALDEHRKHFGRSS